jgi:uroporphyrinogen-III synthase
MKIIITTALEDSRPFQEALNYLNHECLKLPLKKYALQEEDSFIRETFEGFEAYDNVIHGSLRNAEYFWQQIEKFEKEEELKQKVNFVIQPDTQSFFEEKGIPAILPHSKAKAIDVLEFMIRFNRLGTTLYPSGDNTREEMPGLLEELGVAYNDLVVFKERALDQEEVSATRLELKAKNWDAILFHSRSSVNRFFALDDATDFGGKKLLALHEPVAERLSEFGIKDVQQLNGELKNISE